MFYINDSGFALIPTPLDPKRCNYFIVQNTLTIKIETIPEYLSRVTIDYRVAGDLVIVLKPKTGYANSGPYSLTSFSDILANYWIKYYSFIGGLADENFVEVKISSQTAKSVTGDGTEEFPVQLVNDEENPGGPKYYGTNKAGIKGYHPLDSNSGVYTPDEPTTEIPLPVEVNVHSVRVYVEGARQYPGEYTVTPTLVSLNEKVYPGQVVQIFFDPYKASEHIVGEIPAGAIDGANRAFALEYVPDPSRLEIYRTGILQKAAFFVLVSNVFTLTNKIYPGEWLRVDYWTATSADSGSYNLTPDGVVDGVNKTYTLSFAPSYAMVYLERVRQLEGIDYTKTGDQLVFAKAPKPGQRILTDLIP